MDLISALDSSDMLSDSQEFTHDPVTKSGDFQRLSLPVDAFDTPVVSSLSAENLSCTSSLHVCSSVADESVTEDSPTELLDVSQSCACERGQEVTKDTHTG